MEVLRYVLFYVTLGLGGVIASLCGVMVYVNAMNRDWKRFWISLVGLIFTVAMLAKPILILVGVTD